MNNLGSMASI